MRFLSYSWTVAVNLAAIAVALAMLHAAHSQFETIITSGLVLIYTAVIGTFQVLGRSLLHVSRTQLAYFIEVSKYLGRADVEIYSEALKEVDEETKQNLIKFWISNVSNAIIGLIGTIALLMALLQ